MKPGVTFRPPDTARSSVTVKVSASPSAAEASPIVTLGGPASQAAVAVTSAAGVRFTPSVAASFGTVTTTSAPPAGVRMSVYSVPLPAKTPFAAPVTSTSPATNPSTASEKVKVAVNGLRSLIFGGTPVMASVGTALSAMVPVASDAVGESVALTGSDSRTRKVSSVSTRTSGRVFTVTVAEVAPALIVAVRAVPTAV